MQAKNNYKNWVLAFYILSSWQAVGAEVLETNDRFVVNWSKHIVRFYGQASLTKEEGTDFKGMEKKAWHEGVQYARESGPKFLTSQTPVISSEQQQTLVRQFVDSLRSVKTVYYSNEVVVELENSLARLLPMNGAGGGVQSNDASRNTGILFVISGKIQPSADYRVLTEGDGRTLFSAKDISAEGFSKNLMGRWFTRPDEKEIAEAVGEDPARIKVKVQGKDFVVDKDEWLKATQNNRGLLTTAKIAIATF